MLSLFRKPSLYLIFSVVCGLITVYLLAHLIYWYNSNHKLKEISSEYSNLAKPLITPSPSMEVKELEETKKTAEDYFLSVNFVPLREKNPEIVAWLSFPVVDIDIPVPQTTDNEYYLSHDVDRKPNRMGWVFIDARSNIEHLGYNTVLYGHNLANLQMFGSLKKLLNVKEENKEEARYLSFTTLYKEMVFELASVYITDYEDWEYTKQVFVGVEEKQAFIDRMRKRNLLKFFDRDDFSVLDRFLTLSTCYGPVGTKDRLVVHARLVAEREVQNSF